MSAQPILELTEWMKEECDITDMYYMLNEGSFPPLLT